MFEGLVASLLNRYLSDYIDEVDYNNLKLGIFSGTLELLNIKIKPSAMYQFDLPVDVKSGTIGKLKINISWRNILSKPAVAVLEDLFVLLGPFEEKINDPKRIEELSLAHKRKQLQEFENLDKREIVEANREKGYAEQVQDTIINNIQVYVKNVHVRYEDKHSLKNKNVSFGIFLKEFKAETVDGQGKSNFMNADAKIIYKLGSLTGFNIYWNCDVGEHRDYFITTRDDFNSKKDDWVKKMKESIDTNKILSSNFQTFMENNLDLDTRLTIRRSYGKDEMNLPRITFESSVKAIEFVFQRVQYKSILELVDHYNVLNLHKKYVKFRPKEVADKKLKIKLWWRYAFTAYAETTWRSYRKERISAHFKNYKLYRTKYEQKLKAQIAGKQLDSKEIAYLEMLEKDLLLESIFDVRNILMDKYKLNDTTQKDKTAQKDAFDRPLNFVQFRLILNFPLISLKLKNAGIEILRLNLKSIISRLEIKPVQNSIYFLINTHGVDLYGIHYTDSIKSGNNQLVPIIISSQSNTFDQSRDATFMATEDANDLLFVFCFETNPIKYENCEFSIRSKVNSVEVYYEKICITEILRFFKTDLIDFGEVKKIKDVWSKAGVIYAVENHKQFHVMAELASPYFILPVKGTCTEPGEAIVFFLGKTLIQSQVQPKLSNYTPESIEDLEKKFYDKLSLSINEVQVLLVPENIDWKNYLKSYVELNFCHHLLYPVSTQNNLYLSINPSYKKLPKLKLEADISSIRLNFSNHKILKLLDFGKNFPLPDVPKTSGPVTDSPSVTSVTQQVPKKLENKKNEKVTDQNNLFAIKAGPSDGIEPDDEWNGPFNLPKYINGDPIPNYSQILCRFNVADFSIDLNENNTEYLKFIFNSINIDFAVAKYGIFLRASLGYLKLIDKLHESPVTGELFTEILSSSSRDSNQIIKFYFRQVEPDTPNFDALYSKILTNILFDCSNIHVKCHRTAIVYSFNYFKSISDNLDQKKITEEVIDKSKSLPSKVNILSTREDVCQFNLIARMNEFTWNMFDTSVSFGNMIVKELSLSYNLTGPKTDLKAKLRKILINYGDERNQMNEYYRQIISCTGDSTNRQFFDFNIVLYNRDQIKDSASYQDQLKLNVGKIKVICLLKFVNELLDFIDPILNPLPSNLTEQVKEQAFEAVKHAYQETKSENGNKIYFDIHITSPQIIIPQSSNSLSAFCVDLGTMNVTNEFIDITGPHMKISCIQKINLELINLEIKRVNYKSDGHLVKEEVANRISLKCIVSTPVTNYEPFKYPDLDIYVQLKGVELFVSMKTAKLLFAILDENLNEGNKKIEDADKKEDKEIKKDDKQKVQENKPARDRLVLKMNVDLNQIKLIIVELKSKKVIESGSSSRQLEIFSRGSKDDSVFLSTKSTAAFSSPNESDASSKSILSNNLASRISFSHFEIQTVAFKYLKNENSAWRADLNMRSLVLNDVRPDSNLAVKEMFVSSKEEDFIQVSYVFEPPGQSKLDFSLDNLKINLCLPYVLRIYAFAMEAISSEKKKPVPKIDIQFKDKRRTTISPRVEAENIEETLKADTSLNVYGKVNLKEIVLYAQPEKPNSQILIMNAELIIKFDSLNNASFLEIDLIQLGLRLGEHNSKRKGIPFLTPCSAKVTMKQNDPNKPAHYKAEIDTLYFNMTQTLYEVVMGVIGSINQTGTEKVQKATEEKKLLDAAEPFVKHRLDPSDYETSKKQEVTEINDTISINANEKDDQSRKVSEVLDLNIGQAYITFCEETSMESQPLAIIKIQLEGKVANWSKNLHTKASMALEASYYNDILSNWEPLIENIMQKEDEYRPWILSLWFALEPGGILQPPKYGKTIQAIDFPVKDLDYTEVENEENIALPVPVASNIINESEKTKSKKLKRMTKVKKEEKIEKHEEIDQEQEPEAVIDKTVKASYILIESNDLLNINVTPSAYKVIMYLTQITSGSDKEFMESKEKPPLKFLNFMGESCDLFLSEKNRVKPEDAIGFNIKFMNTVKFERSDESNDRIKEIVLNSQRSQIDTVYNENYKFIFSLPNFEKCKLSMKNDGSFLFPLRISKECLNIESMLLKENIKYNVMFRVRTLYGRRKIIFSSPLQIENNSPINLFILIEITNKIKEHIERFKFIDEMQVDDKSYGVIFRLIPTKIFYVPLYFAYNCKIYIAPDNKQFAPSQVFDLKGYNLRVEDYQEINCKKLNNNIENDFNLLRKLSLNVRSHRNVMPAMHANYKVAIYTPIRLINFLPLQIRLDINQNGKTIFNPTLEPGDSLNLNLGVSDLNTCKIHIANYLNVIWLGNIDFNEQIKTKEEIVKIDMVVQPTTEMLVTNKHLSICVSFKQPNEFTFFCPYWLINKSGQPIKIRTTDDMRSFDIPDDSILLFDYRYIDKNNKVRLTINNGSWSHPFSLETAGTTGMIQCHDLKQTYNFLMRITMSNSSRTKLITFAPFLCIANQLDEQISIREYSKYEKSNAKNNWIEVDKITDETKPVALWPNFVGQSKLALFVIKTSDGRETQPFPLENPGRFVLMSKETKKPDNSAENSFIETNSKIITVLISGGSQNPVTIIVRKYKYGDSPAKFVNLCENLHISIFFNNLSWIIEPFTSMFFAWPDVTGQKRELFWTVITAKKAELLKLNQSGNESYNFEIEKKDNSGNSTEIEAEQDPRGKLIKSSRLEHQTVTVNCVSYLEDGQRIVVFTEDESVAEVERTKEASNMEVFVAFRGIQLSIINNVNLEIATISIKDSPSTWEIYDEDQIRIFTREYSEWLDSVFSDYLFYLHAIEAIKKKSVSHLQSPVYHSERFEIDFKKMTIEKPEKGKLIRKYQPGLVVQYRVSTNMMSLKCCVYKVQIDNQLPDAYFPIVFYKTPARIINESLVPFIDANIFTEQQVLTSIYRYFECILQEFHLKADKGFIMSMKDWYDAATITSTKEDKSFDLSDENRIDVPNVLILIDDDKSMYDKMNLDIKLTKEIMEYINPAGNIKQSAHIRFEEFRLSPIFVNMSFSVNGEAHTDDKIVESNRASDFLLNFFLESIGASLTEFKDVKFTFNEYKKSNETKTWSELYDELFDHYKIQALHQAYVLILGLDVLGNPLGLVSDFSEGLTNLFYDPLVDYLSGKDRFDGTEIDMPTKIRLTVNKTISSAAGSGSLITGSIGRVMATFTFDKEYKKKRQFKISKLSTSSLAYTVSTASKGVIGGLVNGVTGVVRKPIDESKRGKKGIFVGLGKGLAGLFAKPVGSVFDGISLTLDGVKRFAQSGSEPIRNVRLPRHLINDVSILPYSEYQAKGYEILRDLQNDDFALDEFYWAHLFVQNRRLKNLIFITDSNIYRLKKTPTQIFKQWSLIQESIPLHKITLSRVVPFDPNALVNVRMRKLELCLLGNTLKDQGLHQLFVTFEKKIDNYNLEADESKILILVSDKTVCEWLNDKIQSAIKYYKDLKNFIEIV